MFKLLISTLILQVTIFAHSLVFNTIDNEDGTMEIIGMFSTGASAEGAKVIILSKASDKIIYENRMPASGSLITKIPSEPYKLVLDSGPGHKLEKNGEIQPIGGFKEVSSKKINFAFYTTLVLSLIFISLAFLLQFYRIKKRVSF